MASCSTRIAVYALLSLPQAPVCQPTVKYPATGRCRRRLLTSCVRLSPSTWMECRWLNSLQFTNKPWKDHVARGGRSAGNLESIGHPIARKEGCPPHRRMGSLKEFQILAGRWSRCFQFRREASCAFSHLWSAIYTSARPQKPTLEIAMDLSVGICLLPLLRFHMRYRVSPQVIATDASETGFGVVGSSTLTLEGSDELSLPALSTAAACDQLGIIELNAGTGGLRRAVELLERVPGVYAASEDDPACCRVLETAWPTRLPQVAAVRSSHIAQLVQSASHVTILLIGARSRLDQSSFGRPPGEETEVFHHFWPNRKPGPLSSTIRKDCSYGRQ